MVKPFPDGPGAVWHPRRGRQGRRAGGSTRPALQIAAPLVRGTRWPGLREQRAAFTALAHPARDCRGEFLGCFYGLQPMHGESGAPSNLLPLKALHSHPGWKEVKEKAMHVFKCREALLHGGLGSLPKSLPARQAGGEGTQPGRGLGKQLSCGRAAPQRP